MSDDAAWYGSDEESFDTLNRQSARPLKAEDVRTPSPARPTRQTSYSFLWDYLPGSAARKDRDSTSETGSLPPLSRGVSSSSGTVTTGSVPTAPPAPIPIRSSAASVSASDERGRSTASRSSGSSGWVQVDPKAAPSGTSLRETESLTREDMQKAIRAGAEEQMRNPAAALSHLKIADDGSFTSLHDARDAQSLGTPASPLDTTPRVIQTDQNGVSSPDPPSPGKEARRKAKFLRCLQEDNVDISQLKSLAWSGIPAELRPITWQLLLNYVPANAARRLTVLARKRQEYAEAVRLAFAKGQGGLDQTTWHQIFIDVPRTNPGVRLWQYDTTQRSMERILYVWAIRHPASGYVQGINDLVTPFFQVFLTSYIECDPENFDIGLLPQSILEALEADSFWCLSKLLDGLQDNYIYAQPGIQRQVARMKELCARVDAPLAAHLEEQNVEFIQFAWRWQNCLLLREIPVKSVVRMWDTYFAEGTDTFAEFHLFVCLAFLVKWSDKLRSMDFQGVIMFLQSLPSTQAWSEEATVMLLSEAYLWRSIWGGAESAHLTSRKQRTTVL